MNVAKYLPYRRKRRRRKMLLSLLGSGIMGAAVFYGLRGERGIKVQQTFNKMKNRFNLAQLRPQ